jgi:hypothetical protein
MNGASLKSVIIWRIYTCIESEFLKILSGCRWFADVCMLCNARFRPLCLSSSTCWSFMAFCLVSFAGVVNHWRKETFLIGITGTNMGYIVARVITNIVWQIYALEVDFYRLGLSLQSYNVFDTLRGKCMHTLQYSSPTHPSREGVCLVETRRHFIMC